MTSIRTLIAACVASLSLLFANAVLAQAESFPNKPLRIVVPFTAGGVVDTVARIVGERLSARYGQAVVVDSRAGAGGTIPTDVVAKSRRMGTTW